MYRFPFRACTDAGDHRSEAVAALASLPIVQSPGPRPATVYRSNFVIEIDPHCVPDAAGTSVTRQLPVSATYRFPLLSSIRPPGMFSTAPPAGAPLLPSPAVPAGLPATVYTSPAVRVPSPHSLSPTAPAISWIRLLPASAIYRSLLWLPRPKCRPIGDSRSEAMASLASLPIVQSPAPRPAITYRSPAFMVPMSPPHWVLVAADGISATRQLPVSAMYMPVAVTTIPDGSFSRVEAATVPLPDSPATPVGLPATVYRSPAVIEMPHSVSLAPATSSIRFPAAS